MFLCSFLGHRGSRLQLGGLGAGFLGLVFRESVGSGGIGVDMF